MKERLIIAGAFLLLFIEIGTLIPLAIDWIQWIFTGKTLMNGLIARI